MEMVNSTPRPLYPPSGTAASIEQEDDWAEATVESFGKEEMYGFLTIYLVLQILGPHIMHLC
jgi:hypothetical protein